MQNLTEWLNANKISPNVQKTEMITFQFQRKKLDGEMEIKLNRKRPNPSNILALILRKT